MREISDFGNKKLFHNKFTALAESSASEADVMHTQYTQTLPFHTL